MLATGPQGGNEAAPDDNAIRREVLSVLAALGPLLLSASRAIDSPQPRDALTALGHAAAVLAPYNLT